MRLRRWAVPVSVVLWMFGCGGEDSPPQSEEPGLRLSGPESLSNVCGTVSVEAMVTSGDIDRVKFSVKRDGEDSVLLPEDASAPFTVTWNTTQFPNGNYTLYASATAAGRQTTVGSVYFVSNVQGGCPTT